MKGKAWAATRTAWAALRWFIAALFGLAYLFVWGVWVIGGLRLLEDIDATAIPFVSNAFFLASAMVMVVGFFGFLRDLLAFRRDPLAFLLAFLRLQPVKDQ